MLFIHCAIWLLSLGFIEAQSLCCLKIDAQACVACPAGTHLFRANCINDVDFCAVYRDGFDCAQCLPGYELVSNETCVKINANQLDYVEEIINVNKPTGTHV